MTEGGKRRANKSLKQWVAFVKKVAKEEGLEYKDAMKRAKVRSDKGEKWQKGGNGDAPMHQGGEGEGNVDASKDNSTASDAAGGSEESVVGGRRQSRRRKTNRRQNSRRNGGRRQSRQQSRRNRRH